MSPSGETIFENCFEKNFPASQTNSAHKHSQLGSQITEPISPCKAYFRSPLREIYARNLQSTLIVSHCAQSEDNFFGCSFFSWSCWSKMGKATTGTTARKQTEADRGEKQVSKRKRGSFKWTDKLWRENDNGDFRNRACFTFSLDNNGDILMLIEIIFDW